MYLKEIKWTILGFMAFMSLTTIITIGLMISDGGKMDYNGHMYWEAYLKFMVCMLLVQTLLVLVPLIITYRLMWKKNNPGDRVSFVSDNKETITKKINFYKELGFIVDRKERMAGREFIHMRRAKHKEKIMQSMKKE